MTHGSSTVVPHSVHLSVHPQLPSTVSICLFTHSCLLQCPSVCSPTAAFYSVHLSGSPTPAFYSVHLYVHPQLPSTVSICLFTHSCLLQCPSVWFTHSCLLQCPSVCSLTDAFYIVGQSGSAIGSGLLAAHCRLLSKGKPRERCVSPFFQRTRPLSPTSKAQLKSTGYIRPGAEFEAFDAS